MQAGVGSMVKPDLEDLWTGRCDLGADGILARENPEALFVTLFAPYATSKCGSVHS